ncbi:receptor-like protein 46 [Mercurialis annua]|uniref:receptor-like protein 46 n=1 Tax=Mercurialis annua TaxID=3986 RepID=UPI0024AD8EAC|nr:receptor-like protein 46 [Mercurialis annua]
MSISNSSLKFVDLSKNKLPLGHDKFPIFSMFYLDLSFNKFSGAIPTTVSPQIMVLQLSHNNFSGTIPQKFRSLNFLSQLSSLRVLNLRNNFFQGRIPNDISNLTSLQILDLSGNKFSGDVPSTLGKLRGMINPNPDISLIYTITLPEQLRSLLEKRGQIPETCGSLKSLRVLNMSYNNLSGKIPRALGEMYNLESLDLSHNTFFGEIPQSFGNLQTLSVLDLSNNKLNGHIPNGPQMDRLNNPDSYANNSGLCGMQIQVPSDKTEPMEDDDDDDDESKETWFSWILAGIAFPAGFFSTILVLYVVGYFQIAPKRSRRRYYIKRGA